VDDVGPALDDIVVDGCCRRKLALAPSFCLTQAVQAENVRSVGVEWLTFDQNFAEPHPESALTCATLEYGA
jgi:hypothetical protein